MAEEQIASLQAQLDALRGGILNPTITVRVPTEKKLRKFGGKTDELRTWLEDCTGIVEVMDSNEAVQYIMRHLEGSARDEISYQKDLIDNDPLKILEILHVVFGEKHDSAQLKKMIYERCQNEKESLDEYARVLSGLVNRLKAVEKSVHCNDVLCEVFCQNVRDKNLRRYLKQVYRSDPEGKFFDLRQQAVQWLEDEGPSVSSSIGVRALEAAPTGIQQNSLDQLTEHLAKVCQVQEKILMHLSNQLPNQALLPPTNIPPVPQRWVTPNSSLAYPNQSFNPVVPPPTTICPPMTQPQATPSDSALRYPNVQCHYCKKFGHYKDQCPVRPPRPAQFVAQKEN